MGPNFWGGGGKEVNLTNMFFYTKLWTRLKEANTVYMKSSRNKWSDVKMATSSRPGDKPTLERMSTTLA